jgi:hypothetical protein
MTETADRIPETGYRKVLARVGVVLVLGVIVASYWWMPATLRRLSFFGVRRIQVSGTRYLTPEAVVRGMGLGDQANVFDDLGELTRRVESIGGVARATVTRRLPATLVVSIVEVEPVALAAGPSGLIPVGQDARPLPYDVVRAPVDAPIVSDANRPLLEGLAKVQQADLGLYTDVVSARLAGSEMVLDMVSGRLRLRTPVDPDVVRALSLVRGDLASRGTAWRELDGRFAKWIVVRKEGESVQHPVVQSPVRPVVRPAARRAPVRRPVRRARPRA